MGGGRRLQRREDTGVFGYYVYRGHSPNTYVEHVWVGQAGDRELRQREVGDHFLAATVLGREGVGSTFSAEVGPSALR